MKINLKYALASIALCAFFSLIGRQIDLERRIDNGFYGTNGYLARLPEIWAVINKGDNCVGQGHFKDAKREYDRALDLVNRTGNLDADQRSMQMFREISWIFKGFGDISFHERDYKEAIRSYHIAVSVQRDGVASIQTEMGLKENHFLDELSPRLYECQKLLEH